MSAKRERYDHKKRHFDFVVGLALYVLTLPVQAVVAVAVAVRLGRPVLFRQPRPGLHGKVFTLVKFRTMKTATAGEGVSSDAARLTSFGRILRATSLDELPTLSNVIKGDMSLVGPRPLLTSYLDRYSPEQARRHEVRPGVTGLAQVNGRNAITWEEKFAMDVDYVNNRSFKLDLQILWATVSSVLRRSGVSAEGQATMTEFHGTTTDGGAS
ncbi:sugar transferase [Mycetocola manganoxydans]|uniref:Sugar transferase n=1 Tax=Mycetocola manganoxydans TaxID=699879 RepID=A0A3L6ZZR2_9MICO|nr:sugar transferase [Mycetocola manganoxydans]